MPSDLADELEDRQSEIEEARAVLLPDLYLDCLVPVRDRDTLASDVDHLIEQGGGNVITRRQRVRLGGNAANTALALASLGVPATLIAPTNRIGHALFEDAMNGLPADPTALQDTDEASCTVALELEADQANVMLSNPGPLASFGPEDLDEHAWSLIEDADVVAVTNWSQTLEHGTRLLEEVTARAHRHGTFTFLDTGDPAHRGSDVEELLAPPTPLDHVSAWGMNEHEACYFAGILDGRDPDRMDLEEAASMLDEQVTPRIDVHTSDIAFTMQDGDRHGIDAFSVTPRHRTGAGDAWNAGNLLGTLLDLEAGSRLTLANAVAALTISQPIQDPVTLADVATFLRET